MDYLWQSLVLVQLLGFSYAFRTNPIEYPEDTTSLTHVQITRAGLWLSLLDFLIENPSWVNQAAIPRNETASFALQLEQGLTKGIIDERLSPLISSPKFPAAVQEIEDANVLVESQDASLPASHFYNEKIRQGSRRLVILKKRIILLMNKGSYEQARREIGRYLHSLQDFYSNSNWAEFQQNLPLEVLGKRLIAEEFVAQPDEPMCRDCTPVKNNWVDNPVDDCSSNLIIAAAKLTSGYKFNKPRNKGKCSHGGLRDDTRRQAATGGINKASNVRVLSPHYRLHNKAARLAIQATKHFFNELRKVVNDTKFAQFFNMEVGYTLSFVIDTSGSMSDEIEFVKKATVDIIDNYARKGSGEKIYYTLSPFSDPEVGPVFSTTDPEAAKAKVANLSANGGGDCPELSMQGLYLALTHSLPDSFLFLFTDAGSKDIHLEPAVLALAKQKRCTIDPVLTNTNICSGKRKRRSTSGKSVYDRLAIATGGQVLEYTKGDVGKVVEVIKDKLVNSSSSTPLHKVMILSVEREDSVSGLPFHVQCDSSVKSMTVLLSAAGAVDIRVEPPGGVGDNGEAQKDNDKIYRVKIKTPKSGNWTFVITATGPYSLKVTAQATLSFKTSLFVENSLEDGSLLVPLTENPVHGANLFVTVTPSLSKIIKNDTNITAYIVQVSGQELGHLTLKPGKDLYRNLYYGKFIPPVNAFRLMLVAYNAENETIKRLVSYLIQPQYFQLTLNRSVDTILTPEELSVVVVTLHNHGGTASFNVEISDDQSYVKSNSSLTLTVNGNSSVDIDITLQAGNNTKDGTTTSVSVTAKISGSGGNNFNSIVFRLSVFTKEFESINETALTAKDLGELLVPITTTSPTTYVRSAMNTTTRIITNDDDDEKIPLYAIILIALATSIAACISTAVVYVLYRSHVSRKTSSTKEHEITVLSNPVTGGKLPAVY